MQRWFALLLGLAFALQAQSAIHPYNKEYFYAGRSVLFGEGEVNGPKPT